MGGLTPPAAGSGTTQHPVPLLVGWAQHTLFHPGAWNRCSSTFGITLWIVLLIPSAPPTQISASLSLKDPEAAPSSERSAPKTSIKRAPWFLSSPSPLSPQIRSTPWAHTIDTGEHARVRPQIQNPSHKVVTVVTIAEVNRTTPD